MFHFKPVLLQRTNSFHGLVWVIWNLHDWSINGVILFQVTKKCGHCLEIKAIFRLMSMTWKDGASFKFSYLAFSLRQLTCTFNAKIEPKRPFTTIWLSLLTFIQYFILFFVYGLWIYLLQHFSSSHCMAAILELFLLIVLAKTSELIHILSLLDFEIRLLP